jgi:ribonuclease-3
MVRDIAADPRDWDAIQQAIGVAFDDVPLLQRALTHTSYLNENPGCSWGDNERLEFLGDAVGDFVAAEHLYHAFPEWTEGQLTSVRAELVRCDTLALFARQVGLGKYLLLGRGEEQSGGRSRAPMLADAFEALVGAIFLARGLEGARMFLEPLIRSRLEILSADASLRDAKSRLQEWAQAAMHATPAYVTVQEQGPDHARQFTVGVIIEGRECGRGTGRSKQAAEQAAATAALKAMADEGSGV